MNASRWMAISVIAALPTSTLAECTPGESKIVTAIPRTGCSANNDGSCGDIVTWNPPDGWLVQQVENVIESENHGGVSVSVIAGGSHFVSETEIEAAHKSLMDAMAQNGNDQYRARLEQSYEDYRSVITEVSATHNTIQARYNAQGTGFLGEGGSIWFHVEAEIQCIGEPGTIQEVQRQLLQRAGISENEWQQATQGGGTGPGPGPGHVSHTDPTALLTSIIGQLNQAQIPSQPMHPALANAVNAQIFAVSQRLQQLGPLVNLQMIGQQQAPDGSTLYYFQANFQFGMNSWQLGVDPSGTLTALYFQ